MYSQIVSDNLTGHGWLMTESSRCHDINHFGGKHANCSKRGYFCQKCPFLCPRIGITSRPRHCPVTIKFNVRVHGMDSMLDIAVFYRLAVAGVITTQVFRIISFWELNFEYFNSLPNYSYIKAVVFPLHRP